MQRHLRNARNLARPIAGHAFPLADILLGASDLFGQGDNATGFCDRTL